MRVYRFENPDGGGPWFTQEGKLRTESVTPPSKSKFKSPVLYGCTPLYKLLDYFKDSRHKVDISNCEIKVYEIPDKDITYINKGTGHVAFPKSYKPIF